MGDRRLLLCIGAAIAALSAGVLAVASGIAALGLTAGVAGVVAGAAGASLGARSRHHEDVLAASDAEVARLSGQIDALTAVLVDQQDTSPTESAFDDLTGLFAERYFAVLVQQQVATARRSLKPVSVAIFELDGLADADDQTRRDALRALGEVVRRTLRESDSACQIGDLMVAAILDDTPEAGAVWAAERVRGTLLAGPLGDRFTVSAGIAGYPSHALGAAELVSQASRALDEARAHGHDRVELAPES